MRDTDDKLYEKAPEQVKKLHRRSRGELRDKARKQWWAKHGKPDVS